MFFRKSVDKVVASLTRAVDDLSEIAIKQREQATRLSAAAANAQDESARALRIVRRLEELVS